MSDPFELRHDPASDLAGAIDRFAVLSQQDGPEIHPLCRSIFLHHSVHTPRALVLLHGFTNCPEQLRELAETAFSAGVNVVVPRAPGHGRIDRSPVGLTGLTAPLLAKAASEAVDIAAGAGERVGVVGFSYGGVAAAWTARNRDDVADVGLVSPAFAPFRSPAALVAPLARLAATLPEAYPWWDPVRQEGAAVPPNCYPRLSRRGMGAVFELGLDAWRGPARRSTRLERATLLLNDNDRAIAAPCALSAFRDGLSGLADRSEVHHLAASLRLPHDFLDPSRPRAASEPDVRAEVSRLLHLTEM